MQSVGSQEIILYSNDIQGARLTYCGLSHAKDKEYPIKGGYSPTPWASAEKGGIGYGANIYLPLDAKIAPGLPYRIKLRIRVFKSYQDSDYFRGHFGPAFTKYIKKQEYEMWDESIYHLNQLEADSIMEISFVVRALCKPDYIVLGVFQEKDEYSQTPCAFCFYKFELYHMSIQNLNDSAVGFEYVCNDYVKEKSTSFNNGSIDTAIYFKTNQLSVGNEYNPLIDSIKLGLGDNAILELIAYTDKAGDRNIELGERRIDAIASKLIETGLDSNQLYRINYGERFSSKHVSDVDRKVILRESNNKLHQKFYTEAVAEMQAGNGAQAFKRMDHWLKYCPYSTAIFALFDCWTLDPKFERIKTRLEYLIRQRFYSNKPITFVLDSLWCEDQKSRSLSHSTVLNFMPGASISCEYPVDSKHQLKLEAMADNIFGKFGFPSKREHGTRAYQAIPYIIIHSQNLVYQKKYLPLFLQACEKKQLSWDLYAILWDKISLKENGFQRYGTQFEINEKGEIKGLHRLEDQRKVREWRHQVGLGPLSDE